MKWRILPAQEEFGKEAKLWYFRGMKPCPKCGCEYQRFAFSITGTGTLTALACFNRACDYTGPWVGPITFPPDRRDGDRAAAAWEAQIVRHSLPPRLSRRLPSATTLDYVKPAPDGGDRHIMSNRPH